MFDFPCHAYDLYMKKVSLCSPWKIFVENTENILLE